MRNTLAKNILSISTLCGLAVALLAGITQATAQEATCYTNYRSCRKHCIQAKAATSWTRCRSELCGSRLNQCLANHAASISAQTFYAFAHAKPHIPRGKNAPRPAPPVYNPTGPIVPEGRVPPPPSSGNGGIVPRDRMPTGGIVPAGHNERSLPDKR